MTEHCKYCDTLTHNIAKEYKNGVLIWAGCFDCYMNKKELENNAPDKKQI